ncbi:MAG TPA: TolC family protein [Terriglobia bacterium]|nr:TolC family protein [Terriglobia bacterium]
MSRINRHTLVAVALICLFCGLPQLYAQGQDSSENAFNQAIARTYTHTNWFPNIAGPYINPRVPPFHLVNSQDLFQLIQNGTMHLSVDDAIALAVENNLNIAVARYNPQYAQIDKVRADSGAATRGISGMFTSSAEFAGAIGGGVGAGTTGFNSGGAGSATGGSAINFTGPSSSFDPVVSFFTGIGYRVSPLGEATVFGSNILSTNETEYAGSVSQAFPTGTSYSISMGGARQSTNALTQLFNPLVDTSLTISVEQNLLNGFGYRSNKRYIYMAENDIGISKDYFEEQVSSAIQTILNDYWTLAEDKQNVAVAEEADKYDAKLLADNKRQVQIGTMAPLDVIQAESALATADQNLIVAQTTYRQQQEVMKTDLSKQVTGPLLTATIDPTTPLPQPKPDDAPSLEAAIAEAHANRPEIDLNRLNLKNENIILKNNRNGLLPTLDLSATYQPLGQNGDQVIFAQGLTGLAPSGQKVPGGLSQAFSQMFRNRYPGYSVALTLSMPIRNRSAQADAARALLEEHYLRTTVQQELNTIDQDVRTAEIGVLQGKARVDAAQKAVEYAREQLTDEQKKYQVGESTVTLVLQMQSALTTAEGTLVTAQAGYAQALTTLQQATGAILQDNNVELVQALTGRVSHHLNIPGTPENPNPPGAPAGTNANPAPQGGGN